MVDLPQETEEFLAKFATRTRWRLVLAACAKRPVVLGVVRAYQSHKGYNYSHLCRIVAEFVGRGLLKKTQVGNKHYYEVTKLGRVILNRWPIKPPFEEIYEQVMQDGKGHANVPQVESKQANNG
jgi:hypothetical protein